MSWQKHHSRTLATGKDLSQARKAAGLSQTELAACIGFGRHAVSYWETKPSISRGQLLYGVPAAICSALGLSFAGLSDPYARARGWGFIEWEQARLNRESARLIAKEAERAKRHRRPCEARTRKGTPCRNKSEPGRRRCKFHGGMSTGPKTPEGKARIAEAQRARWRRYRLEKQSKEIKARAG
jgi:transcriptional regulator with XRE-family HTH domain